MSSGEKTERLEVTQLTAKDQDHLKLIPTHLGVDVYCRLGHQLGLSAGTPAHGLSLGLLVLPHSIMAQL